ncbi:MAG: hypothetical protein N2200_06535 [Bacteroidia bacterium]|nr:hypothetical protein [Bacteroidia bacterium]
MNKALGSLWAGVCVLWAQAPENTPVPYTLADRDRLIRVEARIEALEKRIDALEKRMDAIDRRIDGLERQMEARFSGVERQLDALYNLFIGLFSGFVALVVGAMGLIWWVVQDRRKTLRPIEDSIEQHRRLVAALIRRAPNSPEIASLLEEAGFLQPQAK